MRSSLVHVRAYRTRVHDAYTPHCRTRHQPPLMAMENGEEHTRRRGRNNRWLRVAAGESSDWFFLVRRAITIGSRSLSSVPIVFHRRRRLSRSVHLPCYGLIATSRRYILRSPKITPDQPVADDLERRHDERDDATLLRNGIILK